MKTREYIYMFLIGSLLVAVNTNWSKSSKALVSIAAVSLIISSIKCIIKELRNDE